MDFCGAEAKNGAKESVLNTTTLNTRQATAPGPMTPHSAKGPWRNRAPSSTSSRPAGTLDLPCEAALEPNNTEFCLAAPHQSDTMGTNPVRDRESLGAFRKTISHPCIDGEQPVNFCFIYSQKRRVPKRHALLAILPWAVRRRPRLLSVFSP
jgi:hypothetical protein